MMESNLFKKLITLDDGHEVEAVYEDSLSSGSSIGTVVGFHGSPGSHKMFKFIREKLDTLGIRFIGLNYPGFSHTKSYVGQDFGNVERQMYTNALLEKLNISGRIVYMGHSRGCENALQTAVEKNAHGLVLINPMGLRPNREISPQILLLKAEKKYDSLPKPEADAYILKGYNSRGFRVTSAEECISSLRSMNRAMLDKQHPFIEKLSSLKTKVLFLHAGNDHMMEPEIMFEVLEKYKGLVDLRFTEEPDLEKVYRCFQNSGKGASVFIEKDNHFQNKSRANLIAKSIHTMLTVDVKHKL